MTDRTGHGPKGHLITRDTRTYSLPGSLDDLKGPREGSIRLPKGILWAPGDGVLPLSGGLLRTAYQAVIANGSTRDVCKFLNRDLLVCEWRHLALPIEAAKAWQGRFPELRGNRRAEW